MRRSIFPQPRFLLVLTGLLLPSAAQAQTVPDSAPANVWSASPVFPAGQDVGAAAQPHVNRVQLFRIVPGFLSDPVALIDTDDPKDPTPDAGGPDWIEVSMGNDNPYFDLRRPGDPGGVGFFKVHSQVQVFDTGMTGMTVALEAVTPAGLEQDGVQDGQTVVSPALSLYHTLGDGTGIQGFVSKNVNVSLASMSAPLYYQMQGGFAVQRPLVDTGPDKIGSFYVFVEALGRYHYDTTATTTGPATVWEMVPGIHWHLSDNMWLSGGLLKPLNTPTTTRDAQLWQLTCSFQF